MSIPKSLILLSGGLDSIVNAKQAIDQTDVDMILTFDYGQASAKQEMRSATGVAEKYGIRHKVIILNWLKTLDTGLAGHNIPDFNPERLNDQLYSEQTAKAVWVPNRNGVMINIAASYADAFNIQQIVVGFNKEEASTFPDNSQTFIDKINDSLHYSTMNHPTIVSYTSGMNKNEIVKLGINIDAPFEHLWSCYRSGEVMCGTCESCRRLERAVKNAEYWNTFLKINRWGVMHEK